jgi:FkbM family methyltransferase
MNKLDSYLQALCQKLTRVRGGTRVVQLVLPVIAKNVLQRDLVATAGDGFAFYCRLTGLIEWQLFVYGYFEKDIRDYIAQSLAEGDIFVDVGANIGCFTLLASKLVGGQGRVLAFEPQAEAFGRLSANVQLNSLSNIELNNFALGAAAGEMKLYSSGSDWSHCSSLHPSSWHNEQIFSTVKVVKLDDVLSQASVKQVKLIKIDVEGGELDVLRGAENVLLEFKPRLLIEICQQTYKAAGWELSEMVSFLSRFQYQCHMLQKDGKTAPLEADQVTGSQVNGTLLAW